MSEKGNSSKNDEGDSVYIRPPNVRPLVTDDRFEMPELTEEGLKNARRNQREVYINLNRYFDRTATDPDLMLKAAYTLRYYAEHEKPENVEYLIDWQKVPLFLDLLLESCWKNEKAKEQTVWTLAIIARRSNLLREKLLKLNVLLNLVKFPVDEIERNFGVADIDLISFQTFCLHTLAAILRAQPCPVSIEYTRPVIAYLTPILCKELNRLKRYEDFRSTNYEDFATYFAPTLYKEILSVCDILFLIYDGSRESIASLIETKIYPTLVEFLPLSTSCYPLYQVVVKILANFATHGIYDWIMNVNNVSYIVEVMSSKEARAALEICNMLCNLIADNKSNELIVQLRQGKVIQSVMSTLTKEDFLLRDSALYTMHNVLLAAKADAHNISDMISSGFIKAVCDLLHPENAGITRICIQILEGVCDAVLQIDDSSRQHLRLTNFEREQIENKISDLCVYRGSDNRIFQQAMILLQRMKKCKFC